MLDMPFIALCLGLFSCSVVLCQETSELPATTSSVNPNWPNTLDVQLKTFLEEHNLSNGSDIDQEFKDRLYQAALDVATLHRKSRSPYLDEYSSQVPRLPVWNTKLRHAYTFGSGTANRQDSYIATIREVPLFEDLLGVGGWRYIRYNHSDFLLAIMNKHLVIWRRELNEYQPFDLRVQSAFAILNHESGKLIDCAFFVKSQMTSEKLFLAVATYREAFSVVHIYSVHHDRITPLSYINSEEPIVRLAYLERQGTLLTLISTAVSQDALITFQDDIVRDFKVAKVTLNYPVDVVTFVANGRSFVAATNDSVCDVFAVEDGSQFYTFDRVAVRDIVDLESFRVGADVYLLIVGSYEQLLFYVDENELTLKQRFSIAGVSQMSVFYASFCRDDVALLAIKDTRQQSFVLFNWFNRLKNFEPVPSEIIPESFRPAPKSLVSFWKNQTAYLVTVDRETRKSRVFSVNSVTKPLPNPTLVKGNIMSDIMEDIESRLKQYEKDAQYLRHVLSQAVKAYQRISFNHVLTSLVVEHPNSNIEANHLSDNSGPVIWQGSSLTKADLAVGLYELRKYLKDLENELGHLERETKDLVLRDASSVVTGHKTIHGAVSAPLIKFTMLDLPVVGSFDVKRVMADIFRLNRPQPQLGNIVVKGNLRVNGNLDTVNFNGLDLLHDVLLTSIPQIYPGNLHCVSPFHVRGNMEIKNGELGGVHLPSVVTLSDPHHIPNRVRFTSSLRVTLDLSSTLIDGVDVTKLARDAFRIKHEQYLEVYPESHFPSRFSSVFVNGLINGIDLKYLKNNLIRTNRPAYLKHLTFHDAVFDGGLFVHGLYDGLRFPDSLLTPKRASITAPKRFTKATFLDLVYVDGLVDGLKLPDDVVGLTKDEILPHPLLFSNGLDIENDLSVARLVDGVNMAELLERATSVTVDNSGAVNAVFYGPVVVERHFAVTRPEDVDVESIKRDLIFPEELFIEITGRKQLTSLSAPAVDLRGTVNGYDINRDFVHVKRDQIIKGRKVFKVPVKFARNMTTGKNIVDGVNIVELYHNRVSLGKKSTIPGSLKCFDTVYVDNALTVSGTLDGFSFPDHFIFRDIPEEQSFVGKRFLKGVKANKVELNGDLIVSNLLDGIPINDFLHRRVTLSTNQALSGYFFLGIGNRVDNIETVHINGKDCSDLTNDYVTLSTPQTIFGDIFAWSGDTNVFGDITTSNGINGYKFNELKDRVMKLNNFAPYPYALTFPDGLVVKGNLEARSLNGIDFDKFSRSVFKKSTGALLTGVNRFLSHVAVNGDIEAGLVNRLVLGDALFLKTRDQAVTGMYIFDRVDASSNFDVLQLVNGLDISLLDRSILRRDRNNVVDGNLHFTRPLTISGDLDVSGFINKVDLNALKDRAIRHHPGQEILIGGSKILTGPVTIDGDLLVGYLNGMNISVVFHDMVMINRDGDIYGAKTFLKPVAVPANVMVAGDFVVKGLVAGVNLPEWSDHVAFIDKPNRIRGITVLEENTIFQGTTIIVGKINNVNWPEDLIFLNTDQAQSVYGIKSFEHLTVATNIDVEGLVNHQYHLPSLVLDTFTVDGDQTINGHKSIEGFVIFDDDVYGRVNNVNLLEETVFLDGPRDVIMDGRVFFDGSLLVEGNLRAGRVCEVDLKDLEATAVYTDHEQVINGELHFQNVTVHDVVVEGRVSGLDIDLFQGDVLSLKLEAEESSDQLIRHNKDINNAVSYLENVARRSARYLDHVHLHQGLNFSGYPVESESNRVRLVSREKESVTVATYVLDADGGHFVLESVEKKLMLLVKTAQVGGAVFSLWSDLRGNGVIGDGHYYLVNFTGFVHGDLRRLNDNILLVAILRKDSCQLLEMLVNHETGGLVEVSSVIIDSLIDPVSVHVLKTSTQIYVAIDISPGSITKDVCYKDRDSALLIHTWDLARKTVALFQIMDGASKHLAAFEKNGIHYLAKSDANSGNRNPKTEIKFYRRDDRFEQKFEYSYSVSIPNVAAFEYFEMEDGYQYLGIVNGTHLTLGHLAESHGGFNGHSVIPCRQAYSVRRVLANDGHAYLVVGQGHTLAKNRGLVNLYRLSWTGSRLETLTNL